jgi:hypothetical protein
VIANLHGVQFVAINDQSTLIPIVRAEISDISLMFSMEDEKRVLRQYGEAAWLRWDDERRRALGQEDLDELKGWGLMMGTLDLKFLFIFFIFVYDLAFESSLQSATQSVVLNNLIQSGSGKKMPPLPGTYKRICGQFSFNVSLDYFNQNLLMFEPLLEKSTFFVCLNSSILPAISVSLCSFTPINLNVTPALLSLVGTSKVCFSLLFLLYIFFCTKGQS